jgi:hypothetical protein
MSNLPGTAERAEFKHTASPPPKPWPKVSLHYRGPIRTHTHTHTHTYTYTHTNTGKHTYTRIPQG